MNGSTLSSSQSKLRFRYNTARPCGIHGDTGARRSQDNGLIKSTITEAPGVSQGISHCKSSTENMDRKGTNNNPKPRNMYRRGGIEKSGQAGETDFSMRYLISVVAILMVMVVGGFTYLAHMVLFSNPDLQYHLLDLQKYIMIGESLTLPWHRNWSHLVEREEASTTTTQKDDSSTFAFDVSEIDSEGELDSDQARTTVLSPVYNIPNTMPHIGDKSEEYARLRQDWDERYPPNSPERSLRAVKEVLESGNGLSFIYRRLQPPVMKDNGNAPLDETNESYDIYNCPDDPPPGYPRAYRTIDILKHWPPTQSLPVGSTSIKNKKEGIDFENDGDAAPVIAHLGLCVFDYRRDYGKAMRYRLLEMPFVVRNDPSVAETVERWNDEEYRRALFGSLSHSKQDVMEGDKKNNMTKDNGESPNMVYHRAERSITNQILFRHARKKKSPKFPTGSGEKKNVQNHQEDRTMKGESPLVPPPTKLVAMTYDQWYQRSMEKELNSTIDTETGIQYYDANLNRKKNLYYYYFRFVGCGERDGCERNATEYLFDEMPFFQPRGQSKSKLQRKKLGRKRRKRQREVESEISSSRSNKESLYLVDSDKQRGIHCRFGMPGMIAANHYDASRNAIAVLGGSRRYIISRPNQCVNLGLYPLGHPSARHSIVDWTTASADYEKFGNHSQGNAKAFEKQLISSSTLGAPSWNDYRKALSLLANNAASTEVILQAGDVLYLPSYWFHYIISLTTNMQCNTRSGRDGRDDQIMTDCGFPPANQRN